MWGIPQSPQSKSTIKLPLLPQTISSLVNLLFLGQGVFVEVGNLMAKTSCLLRPGSYHSRCLCLSDVLASEFLFLFFKGPNFLSPTPFSLCVCLYHRQEVPLSLSSLCFLSQKKSWVEWGVTRSTSILREEAMKKYVYIYLYCCFVICN